MVQVALYSQRNIGVGKFRLDFSRCDRLHGTDVVLEFPSVGATENILMAAVERGGNRQDLHEAIRQHSLAAGQRVKQMGLDNDLIDRLKQDALFASVPWETVLNPADYIGRAPQQVDDFLAEHIEPALARYPSSPPADPGLTV